MDLNEHRKPYKQIYCVDNFREFHQVHNYDEVMSYINLDLGYKLESIMQKENCVMLSFTSHHDQYTTMGHNKIRPIHGDPTLGYAVEDFSGTVFEGYDKTVYHWYNNGVAMCIYVDEDATVFCCSTESFHWLHATDITREEITMCDYEDPYTEDEVYEGVIHNILQMPRTLHYNDKTYIRMTLQHPTGSTFILSTHHVLCNIAKCYNEARSLGVKIYAM